MIITDSQVHIWRADTPERPWRKGIGAPGNRTTPLDVPEVVVEMDAAGVNRAVLVPPVLEDGRNDLALDAAAAYPDRFAVMGLFSLRTPRVAELEQWRSTPGMLGIRLNLSHVRNLDFLVDGNSDWFLGTAGRAGIPLMIFSPDRGSGIADAARRFPDVRFILDHMNVASKWQDDQIAAKVDDLRPLAALPNIAVKLSCLPNFVTDAYPFRSLHPYLERVLEWFGPQRCMWGSDLSRLRCPYSECVRAITDGVEFLSPDEKRQVMSGTLEEWLGWPAA